MTRNQGEPLFRSRHHSLPSLSYRGISKDCLLRRHHTLYWRVHTLQYKAHLLLKTTREADAISTSRFTSIVIKRTTSSPWISVLRYFGFLSVWPGLQFPSPRPLGLGLLYVYPRNPVQCRYSQLLLLQELALHHLQLVKFRRNEAFFFSVSRSCFSRWVDPVKLFFSR